MSIKSGNCPKCGPDTACRWSNARCSKCDYEYPDDAEFGWNDQPWWGTALQCVVVPAVFIVPLWIVCTALWWVIGTFACSGNSPYNRHQCADFSLRVVLNRQYHAVKQLRAW